MATIAAGKHVIVEKPLALTLGQADELIAAATKQNRLLVTNLMQRYNPLFESVRRLVEGRVLGEALHGSFENYASDENLPAEHWFWDRTKSGGIFVEHGVHFFDLFTGWLGRGRVEAAQVGVRPGTAIEEHVHATVRYGDVALVNFYHGFHQAGRMDRQELRLVFERGDMTLFDWVPTRGRIHAVADERQTRDLCDLFPGARLDVVASYGGNDRSCRARGKTIDAYQTIDVSFGEGQAKMPLYGRLLRSMMEDQCAWIRDGRHPRVMTEANGRDSLAMACEADKRAHQRADGNP
jgi:predicted dehydrogenase